MKKLVCSILCALLLLSTVACSNESADAEMTENNSNYDVEMNDINNEKDELVPEKTITGLEIWYRLNIGMDDYEMFQANFGDIITEDFYHDLFKLYDRTKIKENDVCVLHTLSDGTRVLLVLQFEDAYKEQFHIKSIEILD